MAARRWVWNYFLQDKPLACVRKEIFSAIPRTGEVHE